MSRSSVLSLFGLLLIAAGCGSSPPKDKPEVAPVSGKLMQKGAPVADALVEFIPTTGAPSTARSNDQGEFELVYSDGTKGAKIGAHNVKVTVGGIVTGEQGGGGEAASKTAKPPTPPTLYVIPMPVTVSPGPNTIDIPVPDKGQPG
jgi:hypothetical protein